MRAVAKLSLRLNVNPPKAFNAQDFLDSAGAARKVEEFKKKEKIFAQGDPSKHVLYIQKGESGFPSSTKAAKKRLLQF